MLLNDIHQQFIDAVRAGVASVSRKRRRCSRASWDRCAERQDGGLSDGLGSVDSVARDVIKAEKTVDYSVRENIAERFAKRLAPTWRRACR